MNLGFLNSCFRDRFIVWNAYVFKIFQSPLGKTDGMGLVTQKCRIPDTAQPLSDGGKISRTTPF